MLKPTLAAACLTALASCAVNPTPAFREVQSTIQQRTGHTLFWNRGTAEDQQAAVALHDLLAHPLTQDSALQIAFLNNPSLQATLENIGIAQADLVQAGLLKNPTFSASWRFPNAPGQTDAEYALAQDFLEILLIPLRKKFAAAELQRTQASVAHDILALTADVQIALLRVQAQQQLLDRLNVLRDIHQTSVELAQRQHDAGTMNDLDLANLQATAAQSKLDLDKAHLELTDDREQLNRLLGLWGNDTAWTTASELPPIPTVEVPLDHLEPLAIAHRLDLAARRRSLQSLGLAAGLSSDFRFLSSLKIGIDTEHETDGSRVTGPTLDLELPLFDQGQARIAKLQSHYRQARQEFLQLAINIRSDVRAARDRLTAQRDLALYYQQTLLPLRGNIVRLTLLHYNGMLTGVYELLLAKQNEVDAQRAAIDALRDYWIARTELQRALGGQLPSPATTNPSTGDSQ